MPRRPLALPACALIVSLAAVAAVPAVARAGGWARPAGGLYTRTGVAYFDGQAAFLLPDAVGVPTGTFHQVAGELYAEAGLGRGFELDLTARWVDNVHSLSDGTQRSSTGLEDAELLGKWSPVSATNALAFVAGTRLAMYRRLPLEDTLDGTPQRGPGGVDLLAGVSFGHSFHPVRAWVGVDLLHRLRLGGPSSGLLARVEAGWFFLESLGGALTVEVQPAFGRDLDQADDAPAPVPKVLALGAKLFVDLWEGLGLTADGQWLPDVLNDGPGFRLAAGVTYER